MATPPLTTISFPAEEMGAIAARLLIDRIDRGRTTPEQVFVRPELTVRGSSGSPRDTGRATRRPVGTRRTDRS